MAIYHATTKPIARSSGRSATASAAYRAGLVITDERTGLTHDYSKRSGVIMSYAFGPDLKLIEGQGRSDLWNKAELAEKRKDSRTAREWILALPYELVPEDEDDKADPRINKAAALAIRFGKELTKRYNVAVDVAIHEPDSEGDNRNYHAHIMTTTRQVEITDDGIVMGDKATIELSNTKRYELGLGASNKEIKDLRKEWENIVNKELELQGYDARIDHRSLKEQGLDRQPTIKMGWKATEMERKGKNTDRGDINRAIIADNERLQELKHELEDLNKKKARELAIPAEYYEPATQTALINEWNERISIIAKELAEQNFKRYVEVITAAKSNKNPSAEQAEEHAKAKGFMQLVSQGEEVVSKAHREQALSVLKEQDKELVRGYLLTLEAINDRKQERKETPQQAQERVELDSVEVVEVEQVVAQPSSRKIPKIR